MKKYYADKTCLNLLRIVLLIVVTALIYLAVRFLGFFPTVMWIAVGVVAAAYIFFGIIYLPLYFRNAAYIISNEEISKHAGFFIRTKQYMRFSAVQHAALITTPFSNYTGLNFIMISALGGKMMLLFLSRSDAEEIYSFISAELRMRKKD